MLIVNGKPHCCNDPFTDIQFTSLLKEYLKRIQTYFYAVRISISLAILSEIFIQIGYFL